MMQMKRFFRSIFLCLCCFASCFSLVLSTASAQTAAQELQQQLDGFNSLTAEFEQRVINADLQLIDLLTGRFFLKRPGLFKWKYADGQQDIVSDGQKIYFIMQDLEQVIERDYATALETVPSLILVTNSSKLSELFTIEKLSTQSRGERFQLKPKSPDSSYESVMVSFMHGKLLGLRLVDALGQTTEIILSGVTNDPKIPNNEFEVEIPKDFDVIQG